MIIGDWQVNTIKETSFPTIPNDVASPIQHLVTYEFKYIPSEFTIERTIHYIEPYNDEKREVFLTDFVGQLKRNFFDFVSGSR